MEFLFGIFVGALLFWVFSERKGISGALIIDFSDINDDGFCSLQLYESLNSVYRKDTIVLEVKAKDFSQE